MLRLSLCTCALASLMLTALAPAVAGQDRKTPQPPAKPDKILYDSGVAAIQKKRFELGRLTLQTLINTYDSSEYLPKAELAVAESWFNEGGARGLDQAQKECKQLIRQFPDSPEAKEAAELLRKIHR